MDQSKQDAQVIDTAAVDALRKMIVGRRTPSMVREMVGWIVEPEGDHPGQG